MTPALERPRPFHGQRVLLCEDEGIVHMLLRRWLTQAGLDVIGSCRTGEEAVPMALEERPDIVLMDVRLPGMTGLQAARAILSVYQPCLLMVSAYDVPALKEEAFGMGARGYVTKPVSKEDLLEQLRLALLPVETTAKIKRNGAGTNRPVPA